MSAGPMGRLNLATHHDPEADAEKEQSGREKTSACEFEAFRGASTVTVPTRRYGTSGE